MQAKEWSFVFSFQSATNILGVSLFSYLVGVSYLMAPIEPNILTICNPILALEALFGNGGCLIGSLSPSLFGNFIQLIFIYLYILGSFYCQVFILPFNLIRFNFSVSPHVPFLIPLFPPPLHLTPPYPSITILFPFSNKICTPPPPSYSIQNLCGSVNCNLVIIDFPANIYVYVNTYRICLSGIPHSG